MISDFWRWPWKFRQNCFTFLSLLTVGFAIEFFSKEPGVSAPGSPLNIYTLLAFVILNVLIYYIPIFKRYIKWAVSFQFIITAVSCLGVLILISGFLPQGKSVLPVFWERIAFSSITSSVPYVFLTIMLCQSLLFACLERMSNFKLRSVPFLLNHLGLFIILSTASLGSSELQRLKMDLVKGQAEWRGYEYSFSQKTDLPFALKLEKFQLEEYPPELLIVDNKTDVIIEHFSLFVKNNKEHKEVINFNNLEIKIIDYLQSSFPMDEKFLPMKHEGTQPSLSVKITDTATTKQVEGWISSGSHISSPKILKVSEDYSLALAKPRAKEYRSQIKYYTPEGEKGEFSLVVNQPYKLKGWKIYQYGYDNEKGQWSDLSIVEVIKDPWLPAVYLGFYMLMAGTILMLVIKRKND